MKEFPTISDERLNRLLKTIKQVTQVGKDGDGKPIIFECHSVDPRKTSCLYSPRLKHERKDIEKFEEIRTYHTCGYIAWFKPSVAEVLACIPEDIEDQVIGFDILKEPSIITIDNQECHTSIAVLYRKKHEEGGKSL